MKKIRCSYCGDKNSVISLDADSRRYHHKKSSLVRLLMEMSGVFRGKNVYFWLLREEKAISVDCAYFTSSF